jgi:hypothetical protein
MNWSVKTFSYLEVAAPALDTNLRLIPIKGLDL